MLKKVIKYTDYNGVEREEPKYFNLSKAEIMEMELSTVGGFAEMIEKVVKAQDIPTIVSVFKEIILKAYGEKSPDGKRFIKVSNGVRLADEFAETEAYSVLFMELATNAEEAAAFVNGIVPEDVAQEAKIKNMLPVT